MPSRSRADSAFYSRAFIDACRRANARFSVTVRQDTAVKKAIAAIPADAWTPIPYWLDGGADVAETTYTFAGTKHAVDVRLIVRPPVRHDPIPYAPAPHPVGEACPKTSKRLTNTRTQHGKASRGKKPLPALAAIVMRCIQA